MVTYSDGYSVKGKFGSNTGASSSKSKSYGYKGKKKKAPTTRAHKILFDPEAPFRAKVFRDRTKYTRKGKKAYL